jgi:hypothetical protein
MQFTHRADGITLGRTSLRILPVFVLGFVGWVKANTWGALAFQAHLGVGGQSKM